MHSDFADAHAKLLINQTVDGGNGEGQDLHSYVRHLNLTGAAMHFWLSRLLDMHTTEWHWMLNKCIDKTDEGWWGIETLVLEKHAQAS